MFSSTSAPMLGAATMGHIGGSSAWNRQDYQAGYMRRSRAERRSKASERRAIRRAECPEAMAFELACEGEGEPADLAFESAIDRFGFEQGWSSDVGYFEPESEEFDDRIATLAVLVYWDEQQRRWDEADTDLLLSA